MPYHLNLVKKNELCQWERDDYYLLKYFPWKSGMHNDATYFILDFKENNTKAVNDAINLFIRMFKNMTHLLRDIYRCKYIVSIPSHAAGKSNTPCERVCATLAEEYTWLAYIPDTLIRIEGVAKSARSSSSKRPTSEDHLRTIKYNGPKLKASDCSFIMIDDVFTLGQTSSACREIIIKSTNCRKVVGIFLGRTQ